MSDDTVNACIRGSEADLIASGWTPPDPIEWQPPRLAWIALAFVLVIEIGVVIRHLLQTA